MVRMIRQGILDFIGAARPSIADPFLPTQDRGGPARRHPRVHRLQHLRVGRLDHVADPLHPESVDGRGVAAGLAPGADPAEGERAPRCWWWAPARPGWRRRSRSASAATGSSWSSDLDSSAAGWRGRRGCPDWLPGIRVVDYREAQLRHARQRRALLRERDDGRRGADLRLRPRGGRHRLDLAARRRRPLAHPADADRRRPWRCSPPTTSWEAPVRRGSGSSLYDDDHYYLGGVLAELLDAKGIEVVLVTPASTVSAWTINTLEQAADPAPPVGTRGRARVVERRDRGRARVRVTLVEHLHRPGIHHSGRGSLVR